MLRYIFLNNIDTLVINFVDLLKSCFCARTQRTLVNLATPRSIYDVVVLSIFPYIYFNFIST